MDNDNLIAFLITISICFCIVIIHEITEYTIYAGIEARLGTMCHISGVPSQYPKENTYYMLGQLEKRLERG